MAIQFQISYAPGFIIYRQVFDSGNLIDGGGGNFVVISPATWQNSAVVMTYDPVNGVYVSDLDTSYQDGIYVVKAYIKSTVDFLISDTNAGILTFQQGAVPSTGTGTPASSPNSYISVEQFLNMKDWRPVAQLSVDDGTQPDKTTLQTNQNLLSILMSSSGEVESYLVAGGRYTSADLQAVNGVSSAFLQQIVADIAMYNLFCRRGANGPPESVIAARDAAYALLDKLNDGKLVLAFTENIEAGIPVNQYMSNADLWNLNLFSNSIRRSLGKRNQFRRGYF